MDLDEQFMKRAKKLAVDLEITDKKELREFIENKIKEFRKEFEDKEREERAERRAQEKELKELELKQKESEQKLAQEKELKELELKQKELEQKLAHDKEKLDHEYKMKQLEINGNEKQTNSNAENSATKRKCKIKMPPFNEEKNEDIISFLTMFEQQVKHEKIAETDWWYHLSTLLSLSSRQTMANMIDETKDYFEIKRILIQHFVKSPDVYRKKFH